MKKEERRELLRWGRWLKPPFLPEHSARDLPFKNEIKLAPESICSFHLYNVDGKLCHCMYSVVCKSPFSTKSTCLPCLRSWVQSPHRKIK